MDRKFISEPEIWGGIECSFNRVKSRYFDQLEHAGHYHRIVEDINEFRKLGITTMRYPVIWERLQPDLNQEINWSTTDEAMSAMKACGISPIAGLVHHGSGPRYADFTSENFPVLLSDFAASVARRYPWINYYTPVNEPLTTARFAGLYGLWYPHKRNDRTFVRILLNELKGVVLAMKRIREINPQAKLVQTEDLAKVYSTPFMKYQADFENHRRWLTWDILSGLLDEKHALWKYFIRYSSAKELMFFRENVCAPDIIGLDYYPTSERYLDEDLSKYPPEKHGANHRHRYADVEAVRIAHGQPSGPVVLFREVWERYRKTVVVTEVHIHCDYDNQIRWFNEIRKAAIRVIAEGADLRAITTWAMLGSFGWNRLLTENGGLYESGAFDVSTGKPIATPLAAFIGALASNANIHHPAVSEPGWWMRDDRFLFQPVRGDAGVVLQPDCIER